MKRVEFDPAARLELDRAADEYEADYPGRGLRFYAAIERVVGIAATTPNAGHQFPGIPDELRVLRVIVRQFPFAIAYRVLGDVNRVLIRITRERSHETGHVVDPFATGQRQLDQRIRWRVVELDAQIGPGDGVIPGVIAAFEANEQHESGRGGGWWSHSGGSFGLAALRGFVARWCWALR